MTDLATAAKALVDAVTFDLCGENGRGGNGGLISDATIRAKDQLRLTLARHDAAGDYFGSLVARARAAASKATAKFPQPNYVTLKIAEEAGEVVRGAVHYAEGRMEWEEVEGEIVQLLAMLIRFVTEGDQVNGIAPPASSSPHPEPVEGEDGKARHAPHGEPVEPRGEPPARARVEGAELIDGIDPAYGAPCHG